MEASSQWVSKVRDYELDFQGIVNHATYINYLEEARTEYSKFGFNLHEFREKGYDIVVADMQIKYLTPLKARDEFCIYTVISEYSDKRIYFKQLIRKIADNRLISKATVVAACVELATGKSFIPNFIQEKLRILGAGRREI